MPLGYMDGRLAFLLNHCQTLHVSTSAHHRRLGAASDLVSRRVREVPEQSDIGQRLFQLHLVV